MSLVGHVEVTLRNLRKVDGRWPPNGNGTVTVAKQNVTKSVILYFVIIFLKYINDSNDNLTINKLKS
jgi:hypothetical protein